MRAPPDGGRADGFKRIAWFIALYAIALVAFAALVYGLRAIIPR